MELKDEYQQEGCTLNSAITLIERGFLRCSINCPIHGLHSVYDLHKCPNKYYKKLIC
jgi:hypothetical protein